MTYFKLITVGAKYLTAAVYSFSIKHPSIRKSFSMASPNSSHVRVFASATTVAALRLACRYPSGASGVPQAKNSQYSTLVVYQFCNSFTVAVFFICYHPTQQIYSESQRRLHPNPFISLCMSPPHTARGAGQHFPLLFEVT